jgi:hypothetical protein
LEERLKYLQEDKDKQEKSINDRWKNKLFDKDLEIKTMESKLKQVE